MSKMKPTTLSLALLLLYLTTTLCDAHPLPSSSEDMSGQEEETCPKNKFWHLRGKACVPLKCKKNQRRDSDSGRCILKGDRTLRQHENLDKLRGTRWTWTAAARGTEIVGLHQARGMSIEPMFMTYRGQRIVSERRHKTMSMARG